MHLNAFLFTEKKEGDQMQYRKKKKYRFAPRGVISNLKLEGKDTSASGSCKALNPTTSLAELPSWYKYNIKAHPQTHLGLTCAMSIM